MQMRLANPAFEEPRAALLGFLGRPYLLIYGLFLAVMVSLSFGIMI